MGTGLYNKYIKQNKKVSVIIPVLNEQERISKLLDSLVNSTYKNLEIIVVDDGSTDKTIEVVKKYQKIDNRIILLKQKHRGADIARNKALDIYTGNYLIFADGDDYFDINTISILVDNMKKYKLDLLTFDAQCVYEGMTAEESGIASDKYIKKHSYNGIMNGLDYFEKVFTGSDYSCVLWLNMINSKIIKDNNIRFINLDHANHGDNSFMIDLFSKCKRVKSLNQVLYYRTVHNDSVMTSPKTLRSVYTIYYQIDYLKNKKLSSTSVDVFIECLKQSAINYLNEIKENIDLKEVKKEYGQDFADFILANTHKHNCIICNKQFKSFNVAGADCELFRKHHVIGGGLRSNCVCPNCFSLDRERWLYYVLLNKTNIFNDKGRVLHFAPEPNIQNFIKSNKNIDYYTCDIQIGRAMHVVDITDIQFKDNTFDYVICNHVMEHIPDEKKAVGEIKRILKPNGKWIFSFPICMDQKTICDPNIKTDKDRLKYYGQEDHVRLYGSDFKDTYENYGLKVEIYTPNEVLKDDEIEKYGFIPDDIIMIATKDGVDN